MRYLVLAAVLALTVPVAIARPAPPVFTMEQRVDLRRISDYLNSVHSMTAHFIQIGPDGTPTEGTLYLKKPGRMRFEYNKPSPLLVIADGSTLSVSNTQLRTTDRYPIFNSPLRVLLSDEVDLSADSRISRVRSEQGALSVTAKQENGPAPGEITLTFADLGGSLELRQWEILDAQRQRTMIVLRDIQMGVDIPARLFKVEDLSPFSHRGD